MKVKRSRTKEVGYNLKAYGSTDRQRYSLSMEQKPNKTPQPSLPSIKLQKHGKYFRISSHQKSLKNVIDINLPKIKSAHTETDTNSKSNIFQDHSQNIRLKPVPLRKPNVLEKLGISANLGLSVSNQKKNYNQYLNINRSRGVFSIVSDKLKNQWLSQLKTLKQQLRRMNDKLSLFSRQFWNFVIFKFQKYHLNNDEKIQFLELISKFFQKQTGQLQISKQFEFYQQMGQKFHQLENRIHFKHRYCLHNLKFLIDHNFHKERFFHVHFPQLNFNMQEDQTRQVASIVRSFCQNNLDAFALLTFYLRISLKNRLEKQTLKTVQAEYLRILAKLAQIFPANDQPSDENFQIYGLKNIPFSQKIQVLEFKKCQKSRLDQLKDFILQKAAKARQDETLFRQLVEDICYKYGYSFKSGLKIKSNKSNSSIFRTIQKLMESKQYQNDFLLYKKLLTQKNQNIHKFSQQSIQLEIKGAQKKIEQLLQKKPIFEFDSKDLLRGKCKFNKIEEIIETVNNLQQHIKKQGHKILQLKNRLGKNTKDVTLIIQLPHSIAQLQIALKLDSVSNQFNHKIYELQRSKIHTPITNLFIHNDRWSEIFFTEQMELFRQVTNMNREPDLNEKLTFKMLSKDVANFRKKYLQPNQIKYEKGFTVQRQQNVKLQQKINEIKLLINQVQQDYRDDQSLDKTDQKENQINFFKSFDYEKALQILQLIDDNELQNNLVLLKLKGDISKQHGLLQESLKYYQRCIEIQKESRSKDINISDIFHNIGWVYDIKQDPYKAIEYYQKSLEIKEEINGEQSLDVATSLNGIGWVYSNLKSKDDYPKALEYYTKSLQIRQNILGKESVDVATSLSNMGVVYRRQGNFTKALEYFKKSLQIRQKILGKQSIDAATSLHNMGVAYHLKKQNQKALQYLRKSAQIRQKILGRQSFDLASSYHYLSFVHEALQNLDHAFRAIKVSTNIFKKVLGPDHHKTKLSYQQYMDLQNKLDKAQKMQNVSVLLAQLAIKKN